MLAGVCAQTFLAGLFCYDEDRAVWDGYLPGLIPFIWQKSSLSRGSVIQEFQLPVNAIAWTSFIEWFSLAEYDLIVLDSGQIFLFCCIV